MLPCPCTENFLDLRSDEFSALRIYRVFTVRSNFSFDSNLATRVPQKEKKRKKEKKLVSYSLGVFFKLIFFDVPP